MAPRSKLRHPNIWPLLLLIVANGLILTSPVPAGLRYAAALVLLMFLPGWIWLQLFLTRPVEIAERITLSIGLSLALTILVAMVTVYLPGPLTTGQLLMTTNTLFVAGLMVVWWQRGIDSVASPAPRYVVLILVVLLILAAALRLPRLGYAEFHEDEAEALMLGVRLFQGEDYALFLHRKGPAQMLLPVAYWLLTGRITETMARLPFALSSMLSTATLFFISRRWFNWQAGVIAGLLWAINGYAIAFGRMVQYQALIFFLGPLAIYCFYLAWKDHQPRLQIPAAILLATCLLAHFDALLLLPAAGYLGWQMISTKGQQANQKFISFSSFTLRPLSLIALALFLFLLAAFYIPYLLDPEFSHTISYLSESRVKPGLLYSNLDLLRRLDNDYSSHFYLPLLALGLISFVVWQSRDFPQKWRGGTAGLGFLALSTWGWPNLWHVDSFSLAVLPWLLLGLVLVWFTSTIEVRTAWVMFGAPFISYVFLVDDPRTHLYIMYPGAALLAGMGWAVLIGKLADWKQGKITPPFNLPAFRSSPLPSLLISSICILLSGLIIVYAFIIFLQPESQLSQLRQQWDGSTWQTIYNDLPKERGYFGYPKREGWKAIGALRAQGQFPGDFRSVNEDFIIPIWYNYGQARSCYNTPAHFFARAAGSNVSATADQYTETGQVQREGKIRLHIFSAGAKPQTSLPIYTLETLADTFDQLATPQHFARQAEPSQQVGTQFGSAIRFVGYELPVATVAPGDTLQIDLYWQALENPGHNYRAFVHLTDGATLWSQQDDDPACRLPTSVWRVGQQGVGQFRLPIDPETPPGHYPLIIGLYQADTLERLPITAAPGQPGDDFLWLQDIEVVQPD